MHVDYCWVVAQNNVAAEQNTGADFACDTGVCKNNTPPDEKTDWKISSENTESGAGLQFLLLGRMAKARRKGMLFLHRHREVFKATVAWLAGNPSHWQVVHPNV